MLYQYSVNSTVTRHLESWYTSQSRAAALWELQLLSVTTDRFKTYWIEKQGPPRKTLGRLTRENLGHRTANPIFLRTRIIRNEPNNPGIQIYRTFWQAWARCASKILIVVKMRLTMYNSEPSTRTIFDSPSHLRDIVGHYMQRIKAVIVPSALIRHNDNPNHVGRHEFHHIRYKGPNPVLRRRVSGYRCNMWKEAF